LDIPPQHKIINQYRGQRVTKKKLSHYCLHKANSIETLGQ
jgi:hypothetical protein